MEVFILTQKGRLSFLSESIKHLKSWNQPPNIAIIYHTWCKDFESFDVRLIYCPSEKQFSKANTALTYAENEWIVITHDDDLLLETTYILWNIAKEMDCSLVVGSATSFGPNSDNWNSKHEEKFSHFLTAPQMIFKEEFLKRGNPIVFPGVLINRYKALSAGGFNENFFHLGDIELWLRLSKTSKFHFENVVNLHYRLHKNQISNNKQALNRLEMSIISSKYLQSSQETYYIQPQKLRILVDLAFLILSFKFRTLFLLFKLKKSINKQ